MANILVIVNRLPFPLSHGSLRTFHLNHYLSKKHNCYLAAFDRNSEQLKPLQEEGIFKTITLLPVHKGRKCFRRHLRLTNENLIKLSSQQYFGNIVKKIENLIENYNINIVVAVTLELAEFIEPLQGVKKIVDDYDCRTLTLEREYEESKKHLSLRQKAKALLMLHRVKTAEAKLALKYDLITTISPVDLEVLKGLTKSNKKKIILLQNGVAPELISNEYEEKEIKNSIIFWGNMDFPPNHSAVWYFYSKVFVPHLMDKGICWYIVGGNPDKEILEMGKNHRNINVTGYVEDLFSLVSRISIMINPMIMGSGLKNKVLEAFALKRLVISNRMGIEAIKGAAPGINYIHAENSKEFAKAVLDYLSADKERIAIGRSARKLVINEYTWEKIGKQWISLIDSLL